MSNTSTDATSASTSSFLTSLAINGAVAGGEFAAFIVVRGYIRAIYEPRTYVPPRDQQAAPLGRLHPFWPLWRIVQADPIDVLEKTGVDPYFFIRYLLMMAKAMIPIWLLSWIVLLPIDAANTGVAGKKGLDRFTYGNVGKDKQARLWAHLLLAWVFNLWIIWLIRGEYKYWLTIRLKWLVNPAHSKLPQATTVLIQSIPQEYMDEVKLEQLFSHLPGGVKRIWLVRNLQDLPGLWERRVNACKKLESAQVKLIKLARQHRLDTQAKIAKLEAKGKPVPDELTGPVNPDLHKGSDGDAETGFIMDPAKLALVDQLVPRSQRPTTRINARWGLGFLGSGQKVDTVEWARKEIAECSAGLEKGREQLKADILSPGTDKDMYAPLNSAFIHFNQQIAAHMAMQCQTDHHPYSMHLHYNEMSPSDVIWSNMKLNPYEQNIRQAISYAVTGGLILLWTFPVAFIGALSSLSTLETYKWMQWLAGDDFGHKLLQGVITGVLPPVLLALLMKVLPFVLRLLIKFEGIPSKKAVELDLMHRYFVFLVIHTFFTVTLSSGLIASIKPLAENPSSAASILANQMPTASTFFITLVLTQFTGTLGTLIQAVRLLLYYVKIVLLGGSPRSVYKVRYSLQSENWGTTFPGVTVYTVIILGYCIISPVINCFGALFFILSALIYKYLFIWVEEQSPESDTGGLFFPKAVQHTFVGLYVQEICLCALFFIARNDEGKVSALPQAIIMIVLTVLTACCHYILNRSFDPLVHPLPLSLAEVGHRETPKPVDMKMFGELLSEASSVRTGITEPHRRFSADTYTSRSPMIDQSGNGSKPELYTAPPKPLPTTSAVLHAAAAEKSKPKARSLNSVPEDREFTPASPTSAGAPKPFFPSEMGGNVELGQMDSPASTAHSTVPNATSVKPSGEEEEDEDETFFAVPGGPGVKPLDQQDPDDPYAFFHPATRQPQPILWLPKDNLGLCEAEIEANASAGVESTCKGATLSHKGRVRVSGPPPDSYLS